MFRFITLPLLVKIFLMLNDLNLVAARSIELIKQDEIENAAGAFFILTCE